jgi:NADPH-dependent 2,4-dienoyl-CoA reductase/sulfur reductase-like enzyme
VWDVLGFGGRATVGRTAIVYDDTGTFEAIAAADALLAAGATVTVVSRHEQLGATVPYPPATVEASRERLLGAGVQLVPAMMLREITPTEVVACGIGNDLVRSFPADTVVIATYHHPNAELADHLEAAGVRVHRVGDVNGTQSIQAAIHAAAAVARAL